MATLLKAWKKSRFRIGGGFVLKVAATLGKFVCPMHSEVKQTKMSIWSRERFIGRVVQGGRWLMP